MLGQWKQTTLDLQHQTEVAGNQVDFPLLSLSMCFLLKIKRDASQITNPKDPNLRKSLSSLSAGRLSLRHDDGSAGQDSLPTLTTAKLSSHVGLLPGLGDVPCLSHTGAQAFERS